jgi:hypothetical protein
VVAETRTMCGYSSGREELGSSYAALRRLLATLDACLPSAVRVRFGSRAIVRLRLAAPAAFLMFRRAAVR